MMYITEYLKKTYSTEELIKMEDELNQDSISSSCYLRVQLELINSKIKSGEVTSPKELIFIGTFYQFLAPTLINKLKDDRKFLLENIISLENKINNLERKNTNSAIQNINSFSRTVAEEPKRVKVFQESKEEFFIYVSCKNNELNRDGKKSKLNLNLFGFILEDIDKLDNLTYNELSANLRIVTSTRQIERIAENLTVTAVCNYCILEIKVIDKINIEYCACDKVPSIETLKRMIDIVEEFKSNK